jgi:hypothetical protein
MEEDFAYEVPAAASGIRMKRGFCFTTDHTDENQNNSNLFLSVFLLLPALPAVSIVRH